MPLTRQPLHALCWHRGRYRTTDAPVEPATLPAGTDVRYRDSVRLTSQGYWRTVRLGEIAEPDDDIRFTTPDLESDAIYTCTPSSWATAFVWPQTGTTDPPCTHCGRPLQDKYEPELCDTCAGRAKRGTTQLSLSLF